MCNSIQSMPSQTMSWSRNCSILTSRPQQPRCSKHAGLTYPWQITSMLWALNPKLLMLSKNGAEHLSLTPNSRNRKNQNPRTNMHVGTAENPMHLAEPPALPRTPHVNFVAKLVIGMPDAKAPLVDRRIQTKNHPDVDPMV